jgi:hypothetical protein
LCNAIELPIDFEGFDIFICIHRWQTMITQKAGGRGTVRGISTEIGEVL